MLWALRRDEWLSVTAAVAHSSVTQGLCALCYWIIKLLLTTLATSDYRASHSHGREHLTFSQCLYTTIRVIVSSGCCEANMLALSCHSCANSMLITLAIHLPSLAGRLCAGRFVERQSSLFIRAYYRPAAAAGVWMWRDASRGTLQFKLYQRTEDTSCSIHQFCDLWFYMIFSLMWKKT